MLRILLLFLCASCSCSILGLASAQKTFYCNSTGINAIRDADFYLVTRRQGESSYPSGLKCNFTAMANNNTQQYLIDILEAEMEGRASLTVRSNTILLNSVTYPSLQTFLTRSEKLEVKFEVPTIYSKRAGVRMRVRAVAKNQCPPGWYKLGSTCFGTSKVTGPLSYRSAQSSCNRMQANLLHVPREFSGSINSLLLQLPRNLTSNDSWIGFTDIARRFNYVWLDRSNFLRTSNLSCHSGGSYISCYIYERCAAVRHPFVYAAYMSSCTSDRDYICYMPPGGASTFFAVPYEESTTTVRPPSSTTFDWGPIVGLVIGLVICTLIGYGCYRCCCGPTRPTVAPQPRRPATPPPSIIGASVYFSDGTVRHAVRTS